MFSTELLSGRVALVTGGAGGIGTRVAASLQACGATVVAADTRLPTEDAQLSNVSNVILDVTQVDQIHQCVEQIVQTHGRLDILVNVAGVVSKGSAAGITESEWQRVIDINLKGSFFCCQAALPIMRKHGFGRIINLGSVLGKNGGNPRPWLNPAEQDQASNVAYGISKAGIHAMTSYLAKETAAHGITVNTVAPGPVASEMTTGFPAALKELIPVGRMGEATEIANAIVFLAAPQTAFITGEVLDVNGGLWAD